MANLRIVIWALTVTVRVLIREAGYLTVEVWGREVQRMPKRSNRARSVADSSSSQHQGSTSLLVLSRGNQPQRCSTLVQWEQFWSSSFYTYQRIKLWPETPSFCGFCFSGRKKLIQHYKTDLLQGSYGNFQHNSFPLSLEQCYPLWRIFFGLNSKVGGSVEEEDREDEKWCSKESYGGLDEKHPPKARSVPSSWQCLLQIRNF